MSRRSRANAVKKQTFFETPGGRTALVVGVLVVLAGVAYAAYEATRGPQASALPCFAPATYGAGVAFGGGVMLLDDGHNASAGGRTMFSVLVTNNGSAARNTTVTATGAEASAKGGPATVAPGKSHVVPVTVDLASNVARAVVLRTSVASADGLAATVPLHLGAGCVGNREAKLCDDVDVDYAGFLPEGPLFDTSLHSIAFSPWPKDSGFHTRPSYSTLPVHLADGSCPQGDPNYITVIPGFQAGVVGMHVGETRVVEIPAKDAYGARPNPQIPLSGKDLDFEIALRSFKSP